MTARALLRMHRAAALACLSVASFARPLAAADERAECVAAAERGQVDRGAGHLRDARASFVRCSAETCPAIVRGDCQRWAAEADASLPTVVFFASDAQGNDVADVRVLLDDKPLVAQLDGRSVPVDPGRHELTFQRAGSGPTHQTVLFVQGEHDRKISVRFDAPGPRGNAGAPPSQGPAAASVPPRARGAANADGPIDASGSGSASMPRDMGDARRTVPTATIALGAVGVVALGSFAVFGIAGKGELADVDASSCAPACDARDIDRVRTKFIIADTSLVVGVISLGVATYLWLTAAPSDRALRGASTSRAANPGIRF